MPLPGNLPTRDSNPSAVCSIARSSRTNPQGTMSMVKEFKEFAMRGNVVDLAVGVIIGGAFGKIVTSMVNDIIMPPIGKAMGGVNFSDLFIRSEERRVGKE